MGLSSIAEATSVQDFIARYPTIFIGFSTADPTKDGSGLAEPVGGGYVRQAVTVTPDGNTLLATVAVPFPVSTSSWGTLTHGTLHTAEVGGVYLGSGEITPFACASNTLVIVPQGTVLLEFDNA